MLLLRQQDNPHTIRGALCEGSSEGIDEWPDVRTRNESRVAMEFNAGYTSALAAAQELTSPSWSQCLQGYGYFSSVSNLTAAVCGMQSCKQLLVQQESEACFAWRCCASVSVG